MNMRININLFFLLSLLTGCASSNQANVKQEYEKPVPKSDFPIQAIQTLELFFPASTTIDYFFEVDAEDESFEAKLIFDEKRYSIEFNVDGSIEDIEIITDFESLEYTVQGAITAFFSEEFSAYSITKLQIQYTTNSSTDEVFLTQVLNQQTDTLTRRYEIEVEGKNKRELGFFEYLFTKDGDLQQKRRIYKRSFDNVW